MTHLPGCHTNEMADTLWRQPESRLSGCEYYRTAIRRLTALDFMALLTISDGAGEDPPPAGAAPDAGGVRKLLRKKRC